MGADRHHRDDVAAHQRADVVEGEDVRRVRHGDDEGAPLPRDAHGAESAGELLLDGAAGVLVGHLVLEVDEADAELLGQHADQLALGHRALLQEDVADATADGLLLAQRRLDDLSRDEAVPDEDLADGDSGADGRCGLVHPLSIGCRRGRP